MTYIPPGEGGSTPVATTATQGKLKADHNSAGDPIALTSAGHGAANGAANGYASLDGSTKVPVAQIPTGTSATTVAIGNDARLSDARTPVAHNHDAADVNAGTLAIARIPTGQTGSTVPFGNDARFSDARTPTGHAHGAGDIQSGTLDIARIPTGQTGTTVPLGNDARLSDSRAPNGNASGQLGGTYPGPDVRGLRETSGPTLLTIGAITDGQLLKRSGSTIISEAAGGGSGFTPGWVRTGAGVRFAAYGDGDPGWLVDALSMASQVGPTATAVTTTAVRLVKFRLPKQLTVTALRAYMLVSASTFSFAVYRVSDSAKMFNTGLIAGVTNAWLNVAISGSPVLAANTDYWLAFGTSAIGTTATWRSFPQMIAGTVFGANVAPWSDQPTVPVFAQAAVTIGATPTWPATLPVPIAAAYVNATTGTIPGVLLEGTAA